MGSDAWRDKITQPPPSRTLPTAAPKGTDLFVEVEEALGTVDVVEAGKALQASVDGHRVEAQLAS